MGLEWFFRDRSVMIHYNFLTNFCGNSKAGCFFCDSSELASSLKI